MRATTTACLNDGGGAAVAAAGRQGRSSNKAPRAPALPKIFRSLRPRERLHAEGAVFNNAPRVITHTLPFNIGLWPGLRLGAHSSSARVGGEWWGQLTSAPPSHADMAAPTDAQLLVAASRYCAEAPDISAVTLKSALAALADVFPGVDLAAHQGRLHEQLARAVHVIQRANSADDGSGSKP